MISLSYFICRGPRILASLTFVAISIFANATQAQESARWTIEDVTGAVKVGDGRGVWRTAQPGQTLGGGTHVVTGADGAVTVRRERDEIVASPGTEFEITSDGDEQPHSVLQTIGRMLFRMETRETRNFSVGTPYLAAAVKGTVFTVEVDTGMAAVSVEEGSVEVTIAATGDAVMVERGGSVSSAQVPASPPGPPEEFTTGVPESAPRAGPPDAGDMPTGGGVPGLSDKAPGSAGRSGEADGDGGPGGGDRGGPGDPGAAGGQAGSGSPGGRGRDREP